MTIRVRTAVLCILASISCVLTSCGEPDQKVGDFLVQEKTVGPVLRDGWMMMNEIASPDGKHFACVDVSENARMRVVLDGQVQREFDAILSMTYSSDGSHLAYVGKEANGHTVMLDGRVVGTIDGFANKQQMGRDLSLTVSPDGSRLALLAFQKGKVVVVEGDKPGPQFDRISKVKFSPDGKRLAYIGSRDGKWFVIVDGNEKEAEDRVGDFILSKDGKHVAYSVIVQNGWDSLTIDGVTQQKFGDIVSGSLRFSPDGSRIGYISAAGSEFRCIVDGQPVSNKSSAGLSDIEFSNHGEHVAYFSLSKPVRQGSDGKAVFEPGSASVVIDGTVIAEFDELRVGSFSFSNDGQHTAWAARRGTEWRVYVDQKAQSPFAAIGEGGIYFNSEGTRVAYSAQGEDKKWRVVVDGVQGEPFDEVNGKSIVFSAEAKHISYIADRDGKSSVVVDGKVGAGYDQLMGNGPRFADDGSLEYLAFRGTPMAKASMVRVKYRPAKQ